MEYAAFQAAPGSYTATYSTGGGAATLSAQSAQALTDGTAMVSWTSSRAADSTVLYGSQPDTLNLQVSDPQPTSSHELALRGLQSRTTYYYRVRSRDSGGHVTVSPAPSAPPLRLTTPARDAAAPRISRVTAEPLPDGTAAITWRTSEPSDSRVEFGTSPGSLDQARVGDRVVRHHSVVLTHLTPGAVYYFRVASEDRARNLADTPASAAPKRFVAAGRGVADTTTAQYRQGALGAGTAATTTTDGELRLARGRRSASFTSRVLDARAMVTWDRASWQADTPAGTSLRVSVRAGSTRKPDGTWTRFVPLSGSGASLTRLVGSSRYIQYRVELVTANPATTPSLRAIGFTYDGRRLGPVIGKEG